MLESVSLQKAVAPIVLVLFWIAAPVHGRAVTFGMREDTVVSISDSACKDVAGQLREIEQEIARSPAERGARPDLRRKIAQLARCADENDNGRDALFRRVAATYFDFYHRAVRFRPATQFVHASKAGGSSFCSSSRGQGCAAPMDGVLDNCFAYFDGPHWVPRHKAGVKQYWSSPQGTRSTFPQGHGTGKYDSCSARAQWAEHFGVTFFANEAYVVGDTIATPWQNNAKPFDASAAINDAMAIAARGPCQQFLNVIIFRDPLARAISNYVHLSRDSVMGGTEFREPRYEALRAAAMANGQTNMSAWASLSPTISNNYFIRVLLGEKLFFAPLGGVKEEHLQLAMRVLEKFDVLLVMETMSSSSGTANIKWGLGWQGMQPVEHRHKAEGANPHLSVNSLPEAQRAVLERNNALDSQLYRAATELHKLDTEFYALLDEKQYKRLQKRSESETCKKRCGWSCQLEWKDWTGQFGGPGHLAR